MTTLKRDNKQCKDYIATIECNKCHECVRAKGSTEEVAELRAGALWGFSHGRAS